MTAPNFKTANDFIEFKAGINHFPVSDLRLKRKDRIKIKWDRIIFTGLIIALGSSLGIQTALNSKKIDVNSESLSSDKAIYDQNERKINAMNRVSSVDIIKFRDNCFQLKSLRMPLSPECKEILE